MTKEELCALALDAIDDALARHVLADAIEESGWSDARYFSLFRHRGWSKRPHSRKQALIVAAVLLFGDFPTSWPMAQNCLRDGFRRGDGWIGEVEDNVPVQGYGAVDDAFWFFRARGETWSFDVYRTPCKPGPPHRGAMLWGTYGPREDRHRTAGDMSAREAWTLIEASLAKYRAARGK